MCSHREANHLLAPLRGLRFETQRLGLYHNPNLWRETSQLARSARREERSVSTGYMSDEQRRDARQGEVSLRVAFRNARITASLLLDVSLRIRSRRRSWFSRILNRNAPRARIAIESSSALGNSRSPSPLPFESLGRKNCVFVLPSGFEPEFQP